MDRARLVTVSALLLAVGLSGCLSGTPAPLGSTPTPVLETDVSGAGCLMTTVLVPTDAATSQQSLPPGFHLRDPRDLLSGVPVATGKAGLFIHAFDCPASAFGGPLRFAWLALFVTTPDVPEAGPAATYDFYALGHLSDHPKLLARWAELGWEHRETGVSVFPVIDLLGDGSGVVHAQAGQVPTQEFAIDQATPAPLPQGLPTLNFQNAVVRVWTDAPAGLSYFGGILNAEVPVGVASCSFSVGSYAFEALGSGTCPSGKDPAAIAATFADFDYTGRLVELPGVHPR